MFLHQQPDAECRCIAFGTHQLCISLMQFINYIILSSIINYTSRLTHITFGSYKIWMIDYRTWNLEIKAKNDWRLHKKNFGPRGPLVLSPVDPWTCEPVRLFARMKNLDHLYSAIYALGLPLDPLGHRFNSRTYLGQFGLVIAALVKQHFEIIYFMVVSTALAVSRLEY